jgi:hypothetical protein
MAGISRAQPTRYNPFGGQPQMDQSNTMNAYRSAIPTQAKDYDRIMEGYQGIVNRGNEGSGDLISRYRSLLDKTGAEPSDVQYQESAEQGTAFRDLKNLVDTGGLSEGEAGDLRARGMSPIRSVYANMSRNMDRQRSISGGYSPSYNAAAGRMARESSESIAGAAQNVNATIAEMRQKGKLSAAPEYAKLADSKTRGMNETALANQRNKTDWAGNQGRLLEGMTTATNNQSKPALDALGGMTSLYGTNPALVETFGKQASDQNQQNQNAVVNKQRYKTGMMGSMSRRF